MTAMEPLELYLYEVNLLIQLDGLYLYRHGIASTFTLFRTTDISINHITVRFLYRVKPTDGGIRWGHKYASKDVQVDTVVLSVFKTKHGVALSVGGRIRINHRGSRQTTGKMLSL